jgi:hypothetical protein
MSETFSEQHPALSEHALEIQATVTAHCDNATSYPIPKSNDGALWLPANSDNLLMATYKADAPDLTNIYTSAPEPGSPVEVVARYWYGTRAHSINPWLRDRTEPRNVFCIVTRLGGGDKDNILAQASSAGYGHGHSEEPPTVESTQALLHALFPDTSLPAKTPLVDQYREAILQKIDQGAVGFTREVYEKYFGQSAANEPGRTVLNGFDLKVNLENRTHLQDHNAVTRVAVRRVIFGIDCDLPYDGLLTQELAISSSPDGEIIDVSQDTTISLVDEPHIQNGQPGVHSTGEPTSRQLPPALQEYAHTPSLPNTKALAWFARLATEPIQEADLYPLGGTKA